MSADTVPAVQRALAQVAAGAAARDREPAFPYDAMTVLAQAGALGRRGSISWSGSSCAPWRRPTARSGASSTATTTPSSASSCWPTSRCAAPTSRRSRPAGGGWACGAPTRRPARASRREIVRNGDELSLEGVKTFCSGAGGLTARSSWPATATRAASPTSTSPKASRSTAHGSPPPACARPRAISWTSTARGSTRCSAGPTSCCATPGSAATPSARPRPGPASPTRPAPPRSRRSRRARWPATTSPPWRSAASTRTRRPSTCGWPRPGAARTPTPRPRCARSRCTCARRSRGPPQALVDEALRAAGSRPLARGGALDRAARDLRIFLLQHRLDPLLVRAGREAVDR